MIGLDTSFLVAYGNSDHPLNAAALKMARAHREEGFALAPQVLTEFVHVVTDSRRFPSSLSLTAALSLASQWWGASEVERVFPTAGSVSLCLEWLDRFQIGRKRILDTMLAATYSAAGISLIATSNWRDFGIYPGIHPLQV